MLTGHGLITQPKMISNVLMVYMCMLKCMQHVHLAVMGWVAEIELLSLYINRLFFI